MPARKPQDIHSIFAAAFSAGDLESLISLYEPDALLVPQPGNVVTGHAAIREALAGFLGLKGTFNLKPGRVFEANGIALLISHWTLTATDPTGNPIAMQGDTSDVVRRQPDGTWRFVIDNPYGANG